MFRTTEETHPRNGMNGESPAREFRRAVRNWARNTFNRDQLRESLKSLAWVAPLSILIWVYAERQQVRPAERRSIPFEIRTNDSRQVVEVLVPSEKVITANLEGPQAMLENLTRELEPSSGHPAVIVLPESYASGKEHFIPARVIRDTELFRNSGVFVSDESPATLRVRIDKLVDVDVEIKPPIGMENFVSPPVFEPRSVKLTLPQALKDKATSGGETLAVYADLGRFDEIRTPGTKTLNEVPLLLPASIRDEANVTLSRDRVTASVDVRNAERQSKIDSLPIWPLYPPNLLGKFVVKMDADFIQNVVITGPRDLIDQIDAGTIEPRPKAILEVTRDDLGKTVSRKLRFDLPAGVKVSREIQEKEVKFTLVEAGAPEQ